jgi:hypothetical protein
MGLEALAQGLGHARQRLPCVELRIEQLGDRSD